jgi:Family of unknown function (DUF6491)
MKRAHSLILFGATLAGCAATAEQPTRTAQKQQEYQRLIAGKVAGPPVSCLPTYNANDMIVIDEQTVAFRQGGNRVYIAHMPGGCSNLGRPPYTMVTKQFGTAQLCRGDIARIVDPVNRITVGSCVFGDFTPYTRAGG